MSTTYDRSNYQRSKMPAKLSKEKLDFVTQAVMEYGWSAEPQSGVKVLLTAPDGKRISVSANDRPLHRFQQTVERHGHRHGTARNPDPVTVRRVSPENKHARQERTSAEALEEVAQEAERTSLEPGQERRVVDEAPMIAYRSATDGTGYVSEVTGERKFDVGPPEYYCLFPGCDWVSEKRGGPARHYKAHQQGPRREQPPSTIKVPPHEPAYRRTYTPRADRVAALAGALHAAMEAGIDWSDLEAASRTLAEEALQWAHRESEDASGLAAEREPLTAEEILGRVRNLLDNGEYLALRERVSALEVQVLEEQKDAQKARDTLRAFRDLAAEVE